MSGSVKRMQIPVRKANRSVPSRMTTVKPLPVSRPKVNQAKAAVRATNAMSNTTFTVLKGALVTRLSTAVVMSPARIQPSPSTSSLMPMAVRGMETMHSSICSQYSVAGEAMASNSQMEASHR